MTLPKPYYQSERVTLYCGDCLEILPMLDAGAVDCVVTDSPYGINTKSDGAGKLNPWADLTNSAFWYAEWFRMCRRVLSQDGSMWACLNWRSLVTFQKASCDASWPIESLMIWDKKWIGPGGSRGLRPSYEMVALFVQSGFSVDDRGIADIQAFPWSSQKPNGHPAEKPVTLKRFCIDNGCAAGGLVLDPFAGSGTTAEAAIRAGRRFVGCEMVERWCEVSARRIQEAEQAFALFEPVKPERQGEMFPEAP